MRLNFFKRLKRLWAMSSEQPIVIDIKPPKITQVVEDLEESEPFAVFQCDVCKQRVIMEDPIYAGQAAVYKCDNCLASWTVYSPQLQKMETKKAEIVWPHLANDPFEEE